MKGVWEGIGRSGRQGEGGEGVLVVQQGRGEDISIGGRCGSEPTGLLGFDSGCKIAKSLLWERESREFITVAGEGYGVGIGVISRCRHPIWSRKRRTGNDGAIDLGLWGRWGGRAGHILP